MENYDITLAKAKAQTALEYLYSEEGYSFEDATSNFKGNVILTTRVLIFGFIDVEVNVYKDETGPATFEYFCCTRGNDNDFEWTSYDFTGISPDFNTIKNDEELEADMFKALMTYAKEQGLFWSQPNDERLQVASC